MNNFNKNLGKNPTLISLSDLNSLSSTNLVGVDNFKKIFETNKFSFSSRLLNYIEPEKIKGIQKTVFYSEVNTEFDKGDKVFIINGNYDSNSYIKTNKYDLDSDGYEVLEIDNGRIVLDVKYDKNKLPYTEVDESDVINIYYVSSVEELEQVSANINIDDDGDFISKKFIEGSNNVIYYDGDLNHNFDAIFDTEYPGILNVVGPTYKGIHQMIYNYTGEYMWKLSNGFDTSSDIIFTGKKIKIINSDFGDYKKGFVYKFYDDKWTPSIENLPPIISKTNFRGGNMLGSFNSGVYGKSESVLEWNYPDAEWGGGFLYNSNWINGIINSLDTGSETFVTRLKDGIPVEESVNPNNNGFGYNYILNSNVKGGVLNNGNIINSNIGTDTTNNIVKNYIEDVIPTTSFVEVNGGLFLDSNIKNSILKDSILNHTNIKNILFNDCLSINSQIESSVFKNSTYITDDVIRILNVKDYELVNGSFNKYQFEISKQSYGRLELGNYFYIKGLIFTKDTNPVNFFHLKFKLSTWVETFEYVNFSNLSKVDLKITSFLSEENDKYYVNVLFENDSNIIFPLTDDIDSTNAFILDSNYESGLFESSNWDSGFNINYNKNNISHSDDSGDYNISIQSDSKIKIKNIIDNFEDDIVFLNSVKHETTASNSTNLPDTYIGLSNKRLEVFPLNNTFMSIVPINTDVYKTGDGYNRKGYVHKLKFTDSKIKSGIFKRNYFKNCLIENKSYDSSDKDFNDLRNIRSLLIDESIFHNNDNFLSSATYINCLISKREDVFINGIIYNSIWDDNIFNKGVFKESTWIGGEFNGGLFYKNRTFDANPTVDKKLKTDNRINSKYIKGKFPNNRYSWQKGTFNGGEMIKSDWEKGIFNDGRFSESKFYDGYINGGIIGNKSIDYSKTRIYQATISDTKVENAYLFAEDYEFTKIEPRGLTWSNGVFEKGVFGSRNFTNVGCYDSPNGVGLVNKASDTDYIFVSDKTSSFRLDIDSGSFKYNLTYTDSGKNVNERNIKSISDSLGNLIEITYDIRSKRYSNYPDYTGSKVDGSYGRTIKYDKNGGDGWIITADDDLSDIYLDDDDNLYICYKTKIEKWTQDKKLLWTINNNFGNLSISGDDDFIYIGGVDINDGYVEKWDSDGVFIWRIGPNEGLDYNNNKDYLQKIIVSDDFLLINGLLSTVSGSSTIDKGRIYKLGKLNGNIDTLTGIYKHQELGGVGTISFPLLDYTYDDISNHIILVENKYVNTTGHKLSFVKVDVSDMEEVASYDIIFTVTTGKNHYTNIEYYNKCVYVKYTNTNTTSNELTSSQILKFNIGDLETTIKEVSLIPSTSPSTNYHGYDNLIFNRFDVKGVGFKYSGEELLDPSQSDGVLNEGPNIYEIEKNTASFEIEGIDFDVSKIKIYYSIKDTEIQISKITPTLTPVIKIYKDDMELTISNFSTLTSDKSPVTFGIINEYELNGDDSVTYYGYATKWIDREVELPTPASDTDNLISSNSKFKIEFTDLFDNDQKYLLKISQFCVYSKEGEMKSIWNDGSFNGGQFVENGQWNDGSFNGGLFLSTYGIDDISKLNTASESQFEYGWKNGKFNGGEFGNGQIENNSTWENGEFNGGVFKGKLWNNGIFTNGKFEGGIDVPILGTDNSSSYVNSIFDVSSIDYESTRGIWRDGYVTAKKDRFVKDKKLFTDLRKKESENKVVLFEDVVFESGTFSHENGVMEDSIWLGGTFESGTFEDSVFNPFMSDKFNTLDTCIWENGLFKGGDFYYSKWNGGLFNTGNAYGMIWNGGICNYMNAYNILWRSGTWKNGNWFGSDFGFDGTTPDVFKKTIMDRINAEYDKEEYHLWNVFKDDSSSYIDFGEGSATDDII